ncbi:MAG: hypothetical protein V3G42_08575 [Oscillospiraceae bacterium]
MEQINPNFEQHQKDFEEMYSLSLQLLDRLEKRLQKHESFCTSFREYKNKVQNMNQDYLNLMKELENNMDDAGNGGMR